MNDSLIVFERIDTATLTASAGSDANYPLVNLQDGRYATQWKAGADTINQTLGIEFAADRRCTSILILNHNFNSLGTSSIRLQIFEAGIWEDAVEIPASASNPLFVTGFDATGKPWRLIFMKAAGALAQIPTIGMIFLGHPTTLPLYLNNPKRGLKVDLIRDQSISGLRYVSASNAERQTWKFDWSLKRQPNADFYRWLESVQIAVHPFWFRDMDDHWHFGRNDFDTVESGSKGNVSFDWRNIQISEERVGIPIELPGGFTV